MIQKSYFHIVLIGVVFILALSACASSETPPPTLDVNIVHTQVAATIAMEYTQTALALPTATTTPEPTLTSPATPTLPPTPIETPTEIIPPTPTGPTPLPVNPATANGCYNATLLADMTDPDVADFKPGDTFKKTWRLINTGTCDWKGDFKITHVGGDLFGTDTTKIRKRVGVGIIVDISLNRVVPGGVGAVTSNWQMATDNGNLFGPVITVSIDLPGGTSTSGSGACYNATLVSDVTIPSGTEMNPGDAFTKTWEIQNSGTCEWTKDFKITHVGGELLGSDTTKIRKFVKDGTTTKISLDMIAPNGSGTMTSSWQMADNTGTLFGQVFTIQIVLK
jgi:hypothetical protein